MHIYHFRFPFKFSKKKMYSEQSELYVLPKAQRIQDIESLNIIEFSLPIDEFRSNFNSILFDKRARDTFNK